MGSNSIKHYKNSAMVSLTPYSAYILGGYTTQDSDDIQNFWVYNQENSRFEKVWRYIQNEHSWGYWTVVNKGRVHLPLYCNLMDLSIWWVGGVHRVH